MNHGNLNLYLGPPGTGKTTFLIDVVEKELASGTPPHRIGFLSFTRRAACEARDRAVEKFGFSPDQLPWFRTIHSMAFAQLGLSKSRVVAPKDLVDLGRRIGVAFSCHASFEDGYLSTAERGDKLVFIENLARVTGRGLQATWRDSDYLIPWSETEQFAASYRRYKETTGKVDYTDMLEQFIQRRAAPSLDVLVVDEAQDLSRIQWDAVRLVAEKCRVVHVGGDDDQAIYRWSGADVDTFVGLAGSEKVLDQSFRISRQIHSFAGRLAKRISFRRDKVFQPRELEGGVEWINSIHEIDLSRGSWLLLARHVYQLSEFEQVCREQGWPYEIRGRSLSDSPVVRAIMVWESMRKGELVPAPAAASALRYVPGTESQVRRLARLGAEEMTSMSELSVPTTEVWHKALKKISLRERDYLLNARRRGEKLLGRPRIRISTIHGSKGAEADNVILATDVSETAFRSMQRNMDDETRVFYVGSTRARDKLYLVGPKSSYYYPF